MSAPDPKIKLAHMAGQIADFFKSYPDDKAVPAIAEHINQFWGWRMREDFLTAFRDDQTGLPPLVAAALGQIKGRRQDAGLPA